MLIFTGHTLVQLPFSVDANGSVTEPDNFAATLLEDLIKQRGASSRT